jgi:hypothetical protein
MLRQRSRWPITIGPRSAERTGSRLRLTGEPREWYVHIRGKEPLIRQKMWEFGSSDHIQNRGGADSGVEIHRTTGFWPKTTDACDIAE